MKKYWYKTILLGITLGTFAACSEDNDPISTPTEPTTFGAYILNTGNWGANNATVQWYDMEKGTVSTDLFATANGKGIGDAQDLYIYGSKIYITCTSSAKIEIVNKKDFKTIKTIPLTNESGKPINPRYITATGGNVYFTAYDGTVSRLDTLNLSITGKLDIGGYPEALTNANGKLYINKSDYKWDSTGKQIAIVDIKSFSKTKELEVVLNPYDESITGDDGKVYFVSTAHGDGNPPHTLQCIDPATDAVTSICQASKIAIKGDKIYFIHSEYYTDDKQIGVYDIKSKTTKDFINYNDVPNPGSIDVEPVSGDVYISSQLDKALNDVYIYSSEGVFKKKIETGYYTTRVRFSTNKAIE